MFKIPEIDLPGDDANTLAGLQANLDAVGDYASRVALVTARWKSKPKPLFNRIRALLEGMCSGNIRCIYCEDSRGDEIEHMRPKSLYPEAAFVWSNYVLACGPCNNPKNNHFAVIPAGVPTLVDVRREPKAAVIKPVSGTPALIDPRTEDPLSLLWLDFGTFRFVPNTDSQLEKLRAQYTIDVLRLNERDELVRGRRSAYSGFISRLQRYCTQAIDWAQVEKDSFIAEFRTERYRTVWLEMIRQRSARPDIDALLQQAPEALAW